MLFGDNFYCSIALVKWWWWW